jgi:hypothetical protein
MLKLFKTPAQISEAQEEEIFFLLNSRITSLAKRLAAKAINHTAEFVRKEQRPPSEEEMENLLKEILK